MALNITQGVQHTGSNTGPIVRDVDDKVYFQQADVAPLIATLKKVKGRSEKVANPKFEWYEKDMGTPILTVDGAVAAGDTTTINVASGEGSSVAAGDTIYVPSTGEQLIVDSVSTDALTVTRSYGETSGAAIADAASLIVLGNVSAEGTNSVTAKSMNSTNVYNYTEIQKDAVELTRTDAGTDRYDEMNPKMVEKRKEIMYYHMEALERKFLFGQRKEDLTGSTPLRTTRGVVPYIATNIHDAGGTFTRAKFNAFLQDIFLYGKGNKLMFVGSDLLDAIDTEIFTNGGTVNLTPASKSFGLDVTEWISPYGKIKFAYHRVLSQIQSGWGIALDLDKVKYRHMLNTKLRTNVHANDYDGFKDEIITEAGLQLMNEKCHGIFKLD